MAETLGLNHLGLAVADLNETTNFFVKVLGWTKSARDDSYPRNSVTDGTVRLTLWQVDISKPTTEFNRRTNVGLHHLALTIETEADLMRIARKIAVWPGVQMEFVPELMGDGPRKHMMFSEPGGIRLELVWNGM